MPILSQTIDVTEQSATIQVFRALHRAIVTLEIEPGTKVSEAEIAKKLGVSRQPVRDAFYRLSEIGFLKIRPQRPTTISHISERALLDARLVRTALEVECLAQSLECISAKQLTQLENNLEQQHDAISVNDKLKFHMLDDLFHQKLVQCSGHGEVWSIVKDQKVHLDRVRYLSLDTGAQIAFEEHREIIRLIHARDSVGAERILRKHLSNIMDTLAKVRMEHSHYFEQEF